MPILMKIINSRWATALLACLCATTHAQISSNELVLGWTLNTPRGTLNPAPLRPPVSQADPIHISGMTRVTPTAAVLALRGLPASEDANTYVSSRFTTGSVPEADIVLNLAGYSLSNPNFGSQFQIRSVSYDVTNDITYPLADTVNFNQVRSVVNVGNPFGTYFIVNNQTWPMRSDEKQAEQGQLPAFKKPIILAPDNTYEFRFYMSQQGTADGRGMIDDIIVYMKTVAVKTEADGIFSFPAQSGGTTTEKVQDNDLINELPLETDTYTLSVLNADPGLSLNPDGTITAAPGQPGTKTLTYQLCPKYDTELVTGFQSNACKTAISTIELTPSPALPPSVSISCTPNTLTGSENQQAICTITADTVVSSDLRIGLIPLASTDRFAGSCTNLSSITIAAGQDSATCFVTVIANPSPGNVTAVMTIADPLSLAPPLYTVGVRSDSVEIENDDDVAPTAASPVPSLGQWAAVALTVLLAIVGAAQIRSRRQ